MTSVALELAEYHAPPAEDQAMSYLLTLDKSRLIERHAYEVAVLKQDIEGHEAHAGELGNVIRLMGRKIDRLMLGIAAVALFAAYVLVRDIGCGVAWWGR